MVRGRGREKKQALRMKVKVEVQHVKKEKERQERDDERKENVCEILYVSCENTRCITRGRILLDALLIKTSFW